MQIINKVEGFTVFRGHNTDYLFKNGLIQNGSRFTALKLKVVKFIKFVKQ